MEKRGEAWKPWTMTGNVQRDVEIVYFECQGQRYSNSRLSQDVLVQWANVMGIDPYHLVHKGKSSHAIAYTFRTHLS